MKLLFDENLSHRLVDRLAAEFPGSIHVRDVGLKAVGDPKVWAYAAANVGRRAAPFAVRQHPGVRCRSVRGIPRVDLTRQPWRRQMLEGNMARTVCRFRNLATLALPLCAVGCAASAPMSQEDLRNRAFAKVHALVTATSYGDSERALDKLAETVGGERMLCVDECANLLMSAFPYLRWCGAEALGELSKRQFGRALIELRMSDVSGKELIPDRHAVVVIPEAEFSFALYAMGDDWHPNYLKIKKWWEGRRSSFASATAAADGK